jgi:hypothetical protein
MPQWLAKLASLVVPDLTRPLVEVMCTDSCGDASVACDIFGIRMTDLKEIWTKTSG